MRIFCKYFLLLLLVSCTTQPTNSLKYDATINQVFEAAEIEDLTVILRFFESQICGQHYNVLECYKEFFHRLDSAEISGSLDISIPFEQQIELYENISKSTFDEIWAFNKKWTYTSPRDTLKAISYNYKGKYVDFLKTLGETDNTVNRYHYSFEASGDISPSMVGSLLKHYDNYVIEDVKIRLLIAIHYLTLNDELNRSEIY